MRKLKLSAGERQFTNLKELREARGELAKQFQALGEAFAGRKAKRDAGEDISLWGEGEEARFKSLGDDLKILDAAADEEQRAMDVAAQVAATQRANGTEPETRLPSGDTGEGGGERRITVPARARPIGKLKAFRSMEDAYAAGQWIRGALMGHESAAQWCRDHLPQENRAMSGVALQKGGVLVPSAMASAIIDLVEQYGVALADCEIVPMGTDTIDWPRVTGGVTMYAVGENAEITASDPGFDSINLTARKYGVLVKYPSELDDDAVISIAEFLARKTAWAWAKKLDECLFLGDGTSTYHGVVGIKNALAAGSKATALAGNTTFGTLDLVDFEAIIGKLATWGEARAKWYISKAGWAASMMRLADAAGGSENLAGSPARTFLGYPVRISPVMNSTLTAQTSTEGLAYLGDLAGGVMIGMRRDIRMALSRERYLEYDQVGFMATVRFDLNVHDRGGASTAGGIIGLGTPAS
jgi:HK97 family phage major capsid protein